MGRTTRSQVQPRLPAGAVVFAILALQITACAPAPELMVSGPFQLSRQQVARLTVRHIRFCAGGENLNATLAFTDKLGRTVVNKQTRLRCGDSVQLPLYGEQAPQGPLTARVQYQPHLTIPPEGSVEVISATGLEQETSVVHVLVPTSR